MRKYLPVCLAIVTMGTIGCVKESFIPTAPTTTQQIVPITITVHTLEYQRSTPVSHVIVMVNDHIQGETDETGALVVESIAGRETKIACMRAGWETMLPSASAIVSHSGEIWTFYLQAVAN